MDQRTSFIQPIKKAKVACDLQRFNLRYPKTSNLEFNNKKNDFNPKHMEVKLKRAMMKRLICQKLAINFHFSNPRHHIAILARQLPQCTNLKSLKVRLSGSRSIILSTFLQILDLGISVYKISLLGSSKVFSQNYESSKAFSFGRTLHKQGWLIFL